MKGKKSLTLLDILRDRQAPLLAVSNQSEEGVSDTRQSTTEALKSSGEAPEGNSGSSGEVPQQRRTLREIMTERKLPITTAGSGRPYTLSDFIQEKGGDPEEVRRQQEAEFHQASLLKHNRSMPKIESGQPTDASQESDESPKVKDLWSCEEDVFNFLAINFPEFSFLNDAYNQLMEIVEIGEDYRDKMSSTGRAKMSESDLQEDGYYYENLSQKIRDILKCPFIFQYPKNVYFAHLLKEGDFTMKQLATYLWQKHQWILNAIETAKQQIEEESLRALGEIQQLPSMELMGVVDRSLDPDEENSILVKEDMPENPEDRPHWFSLQAWLAFLTHEDYLGTESQAIQKSMAQLFFGTFNPAIISSLHVQQSALFAELKGLLAGGLVTAERGVEIENALNHAFASVEGFIEIESLGERPEIQKASDFRKIHFDLDQPLKPLKLRLLTGENIEMIFQQACPEAYVDLQEAYNELTEIIDQTLVNNEAAEYRAVSRYLSQNPLTQAAFSAEPQEYFFQLFKKNSVNMGLYSMHACVAHKAAAIRQAIEEARESAKRESSDSLRQLEEIQQFFPPHNLEQSGLPDK